MLKMTIVVCALLSAAPCSGAAAVTWSAANAKWVKVNTDPPFTAYVDRKSIRVQGKFRDVWQKDVEDVADPNRVAVTITRWRYNCVTRQSTMLFYEAFLKNGAPFGSDGVSKSEQVWDDVLPESTGAVVMKFTCSAKIHH